MRPSFIGYGRPPSFANQQPQDFDYPPRRDCGPPPFNGPMSQRFLGPPAIGAPRSGFPSGIRPRFPVRPTGPSDAPQNYPVWGSSRYMHPGYRDFTSNFEPEIDAMIRDSGITHNSDAFKRIQEIRQRANQALPHYRPKGIQKLLIDAMEPDSDSENEDEPPEKDDEPDWTLNEPMRSLPEPEPNPLLERQGQRAPLVDAAARPPPDLALHEPIKPQPEPEPSALIKRQRVPLLNDAPSDDAASSSHEDFTKSVASVLAKAVNALAEDFNIFLPGAYPYGGIGPFMEIDPPPLDHLAYYHEESVKSNYKSYAKFMYDYDPRFTWDEEKEKHKIKAQPSWLETTPKFEMPKRPPHYNWEVRDYDPYADDIWMDLEYILYTKHAKMSIVKCALIREENAALKKPKAGEWLEPIPESDTMFGPDERDLPTNKLLYAIVKRIGNPQAFVETQYCGICDASLPSVVVGMQHYDSDKHMKQVRHWFLNQMIWYKVLPMEEAYAQWVEDAITRAVKRLRVKPSHWRCSTCDMQLSSLSMAEKHFTSKAHRRLSVGLPRVKSIPTSMVDYFRLHCIPCGVEFETVEEGRVHIYVEGHEERVRAMAQARISVPPGPSATIPGTRHIGQDGKPYYVTKETASRLNAKITAKVSGTGRSMYANANAATGANMTALGTGRGKGTKQPMGGEQGSNQPIRGGFQAMKRGRGTNPPMGGGRGSSQPMGGGRGSNQPIGEDTRANQPMGGGRGSNQPMRGGRGTSRPMTFISFQKGGTAIGNQLVPSNLSDQSNCPPSTSSAFPAKRTSSVFRDQFYCQLCQKQLLNSDAYNSHIHSLQHARKETLAALEIIKQGSSKRLINEGNEPPPSKKQKSASNMKLLATNMLTHSVMTPNSSSKFRYEPS